MKIYTIAQEEEYTQYIRSNLESDIKAKIISLFKNPTGNRGLPISNIKLETAYDNYDALSLLKIDIIIPNISEDIKKIKPETNSIYYSSQIIKSRKLHEAIQEITKVWPEIRLLLKN